MSQELEPTPPDTDVLLVLPAGEVSGHSIPFCFFPHPCLKAMTQAAEKDAKKQLQKFMSKLLRNTINISREILY